jgi:hypothetical protein
MKKRGRREFLVHRNGGGVMRWQRRGRRARRRALLPQGEG